MRHKWWRGWTLRYFMLGGFILGLLNIGIWDSYYQIWICLVGMGSGSKWIGFFMEHGAFCLHMLTCGLCLAMLLVILLVPLTIVISTMIIVGNSVTWVGFGCMTQLGILNTIGILEWNFNFKQVFLWLFSWIMNSSAPWELSPSLFLFLLTSIIVIGALGIFLCAPSPIKNSFQDKNISQLSLHCSNSSKIKF